MIEGLEERLQRAFATGDESELDVLGYGEISTVLAHEHEGARYACKRLPDFDSRERFDRYAEVFERYVQSLGEAGVEAVPSTLVALDRKNAVAGWCVQRVLPAEGMLIRRMREASLAEAEALFERLCEGILAAVDARRGLDAQISNWAIVGDRMLYLDLTTPLLRDASGKEELDTGLFLASLPWALRGPVYLFLLRSILDKYHDPRGVVLDVLGNLHKEKLAHLIEPLMALANRRLERPLSAKEIRAYYEDDASTWALLQRLRRADRWWQRKVRRRPYPFLLPGRIER